MCWNEINEILWRDSVVHFVKCDEFVLFTSVCEGLPFKLGQHGLDITVFSCTRNNTGSSLVLYRFNVRFLLICAVVT